MIKHLSDIVIEFFKWSIMVFDFILTIILSVVVNLLVTKPCARLLDLVMRKEEKKSRDVNHDNELKINGKGKLSDELDDNGIIVLKAVSFEKSPVLHDKQKTTDTWLQNLVPNNFDQNNNPNNDKAIEENELNRKVSIQL